MTKLIRAFFAMMMLTLLSACGGGGGSAGNTSGVGLFTTAPEKIRIAPNETQTYNIGGGIPNYKATSSSSSASVSVSDKILKITGVSGGSATITITDSSGAKVLIEASVGTGVDVYTTAPEKLTLGVGSVTSNFTVGGGSGIYFVTSGNRQIVSVNQNGSQFSLTGVGAGVATVTVTDTLGGTKNIEVTVGSGVDLYTTAPSSVVVGVGTSSAIYSIGGGSQVYSISSSDQNVATVGISNRTDFIINGKSGGSATVIIRDTQGKTVSIDVVVGTKTKLFSTAAGETKVEVGGSNMYKVGGGTTIYSVGSSNSAVVKAVLNGNDLTITGISAGTATVIVTDSAANTLEIKVTVGTGAPTPLFTTAGTDIVVAIGSNPTFTVSGGKAPYSVSSSNAVVVTASISGSTLSISGVSEGSGKISISDADGTKLTVNVMVGNGIVVPLYTTAPSSVTIAPSATATYAVGGGTGPYTFTSSNVAVATVAGSGKSFSISGVINGNATVIVRDSAGNSTSIDVTVSDGPQLSLFTTAPANITIGVGAPIPYVIGGGKAPYVVTSSNTGVATVSYSQNSYSVTGVAQGSASYVIRDALGAVVTINVTVGSGPQVPLFSTAPNSIVLATGGIASFVASGGTGPYTVASSDSLVAIVSPVTSFGSSFTIAGGVSGSATVVLRDSVGAAVSISVTINKGASIPLFTTAPPNLSLSAGSGAVTYSIGGGTGPYTVSSSNPVVATGSSIGGSSFTISGNTVGSATIVIRDAVGASVSVNVTVGTSVPLFTTAPSSVTVLSGSTTSYNASGGTGPYTVSSSNTAVATVAPGSGSFASSFTITGVSAGAAQIIVRDLFGAQVSIALTVSPTASIPIDVLPGDSTGSVGDTLTFRVSGGTAPFTVTNNNPSIATVLPTTIASAGGTFTAALLNAGSTVVSITDAQGQVKKITVTSNVANSSMRISPSAIEIGEDNSQPFDLLIKGGTGPYRVFTSDLVKSGVTISGNTITVSVGTQLTRCIHPVDLASPPVYQRGSTYVVTITALDSLGTSATSTMSIRDNSKGVGIDNCGN